VHIEQKSKWNVENLYLPMAGSSTACAACSSLTGVLSHIFFSFIATGESESSAVATRKFKNGNWLATFS
jgi:hypothetical protein